MVGEFPRQSAHSSCKASRYQNSQASDGSKFRRQMLPYYFASSSRLHICPSAVRAQARRDLRPMTSALSSHLEPLSQPVTAARLSPPPSLQQEKTGFDGSNPSRCGEHSPAPCQVPAVITPNRRATLERACQMEIPNPGRGLLRSFKKTTDAPLSPFPRFPEELFSFFSEKNTATTHITAG